MPKNLLNCDRVFHASHDLDWAFTLLADLDVNIEHPFQSLHPGHGGMTLGWGVVFPCPTRLGFTTFSSLRWCDVNPVHAVGGEDSVKSGEIDPGLGH